MHKKDTKDLLGTQKNHIKHSNLYLSFLCYSFEAALKMRTSTVQGWIINREVLPFS